MKTLSWLITLALASSVTETLTFDRATFGRTPAGWTAVGSGPASAEAWKIIKDPSAPTQPYVLAHEPQNGAGGDIPRMAILQGPVCRDGEISVKFKPVAGKQDQDAGLVWRYRDPNNYYVVRADAQEKNVAMYRVVNGKPIPLAPRGRHAGSYAVRHLVSPNTWGILKVVFKGPAYSVYYDHRRILQVDDASYTGPGKVGVWTRSDSLTYFDNFHVIRKQ
jgi:hypothetical protein